jgi:endonuclease YncB( thermonuclease family)
MSVSPRRRTTPASGQRAKPPFARGVPLERYLRLTRRQHQLLTLSVLLIGAALAAADRLWLYRGGDLGRYDGQTFAVVRVIDGDTLDVDVPDPNAPHGPIATTRIRLWGMDTPETAKPFLNKPGEPFGDEATEFTRKLCAGRRVTLQLEAHRLRGRYGRVLAFVTLPDGTMLNERLLAAGLATADDRFSHRHFDRFALIEQQARHDKLGLWGEGKSRAGP